MGEKEKNNLIFHLYNANCLGFDYSRLIDCQTRLLSSGTVCKFACQMRQRGGEREQDRFPNEERLVRLKEARREMRRERETAEWGEDYTNVLDHFIWAICNIDTKTHVVQYERSSLGIQSKRFIMISWISIATAKEQFHDIGIL